MTGIHKEEEGRLRRQFTIAEVSDGGGNDSNTAVIALRARGNAII